MQRQSGSTVTISFIVPIYNMESTIAKCLDSILNQTYYDYEVVLINDGSTDKSEDICKEYQARDTRVVFFSRENRGLSSTYKEGIQRARGEFLIFVDSDDYVEPNMAEVLFTKQRESDADIVEAGIVYEKTDYSLIRSLIFEERFISDQNDLIFDYFFTGKINKTFAGNLFKKELFNNVEFRPEARSIDIQTLPYVYSKCNRFVQISEAFYHAVMSDNSVSRGEISDLMYADKQLCTQVLDDFFNHIAPQYVDYMFYRHTIVACDVYEKLLHSANISDREIKKKDCLCEFKKYYKKYISSDVCKYIERKARFKILLFRINPRLYSFVINLRKQSLKG